MCSTQTGSSDEITQSDVAISDSAVDNAETVCLEDLHVTSEDDLAIGVAQSLHAVTDAIAETDARPPQLSLV